MSALVATRPRMTRDAAVRWTRIAILAGLAVAIEIYGRYFADPAFMKPVSAILAAWVDPILSDPRIVWALVMTSFEIALAYALSVVVGLAAGLAIGATDLTRKSLFPIILLLYAIPQVSLIPLFILAFGLGPAAKIAFGFSHGVFPIIVNVVAGMRNVNPLYLRAVDSMGGSRIDAIRHVIFPNMVPAFFTGLRLAMTLTLLGVILAELYVSTGGIGYFTRLYAESYNPAPLFALIGSLAIIAITFTTIPTGPIPIPATASACTSSGAAPPEGRSDGDRKVAVRQELGNAEDAVFELAMYGNEVLRGPRPITGPIDQMASQFRWEAPTRPMLCMMRNLCLHLSNTPVCSFPKFYSPMGIRNGILNRSVPHFAYTGKGNVVIADGLLKFFPYDVFVSKRRRRH